MNSAHLVLLVEDEPRIASLVRDYLNAAAIPMVWVTDGNDALAEFQQQPFDMVLLDINLPHVSGLDICRQIRKTSTVPIIMLSAMCDEAARLECLAIEADDFISKPFSPRELVAKIQALLRRTTGQWSMTLQPSITAALIIDEAGYEARLSTAAVSLTKIEFKLLKTLSQHPGRIYSRNQLMNAMYGDFRVVSERTIDSHIKKLRKKLLQLEPTTELIESCYGAGYRYRGRAPKLRQID
ncbi:response regulator [Shewanella yunxiaonensis]|uniref:response regulator n=1 Tax=Shewanella yunxiaonensis TaxID=2829809 RepID=UPI001E48B63C|nr:response regulator [Shewanella yunxiaonensis]